jgi:hypothetical protein
VARRDYGASCALLLPASSTSTGSSSSSSWWLLQAASARRINWPALRGALDAFVVAHALGWWGKALLLRNTQLLWVYSIAFELLEASCAVR